MGTTGTVGVKATFRCPHATLLERKMHIGVVVTSTSRVDPAVTIHWENIQDAERYANHDTQTGSRSDSAIDSTAQHNSCYSIPSLELNCIYLLEAPLVTEWSPETFDVQSIGVHVPSMWETYVPLSSRQCPATADTRCELLSWSVL